MLKHLGFRLTARVFRPPQLVLNIPWNARADADASLTPRRSRGLALSNART